MTDVSFVLRDIDKKVTDAFTWAFIGGGKYPTLDPKEYPFEVSCGDFIADDFKATLTKCDAVVAAGNSYGYMDGGLDYKYQQWWGNLQAVVQDTIKQIYSGDLIVGEAAIIDMSVVPMPTTSVTISRPRWLIYAPTMRVPGDVSASPNAYLAFRGVLNALEFHNRSIQDESLMIKRVACPGLCTAVGGMPAVRCALQMKTAYDAVIHSRGEVYKVYSDPSLQAARMNEVMLHTIKHPF